MINSSTNSSINLYSAGVKGFRYPFNKDSLFSGRMTSSSQFSFDPCSETNKKLEGTRRSGRA